MQSRFSLWLLALCLFTAAVSGIPAASAAGEGETLVYSWNSNVGPLNPHLYSPNQMFAQGMVYEPLVQYQADGSIAPWLAESWNISEDGKTYDFTLRQGVVFSDGTPFDAKAVKMNFDAILKNRKRHEWLELINQIESVTVLDPRTARITLREAYYPALQELALIRPPRFLSPSAFPDDGDTSKGMKAPIGTGPWKLVEIKKGEYDVFEANERYWGQKPFFKRLVVKVIPDSSARSIAFETGEIDLIYGSGGHGGGQLGLDEFKRFQASKDLVTDVSGPLATRSLAVNSNRFPTNDLAVRKAILHAVDKKAMAEHIFLGVEKQADTLFAPNMPYCDLGLPPYAFDLEKSAELLENAGWKLDPASGYRMKDGAELSLDLCFVGNDALQKAVAEVIQGDLRKAGIKVNLVGEEPDSFNVRQKNGEFGMIFDDTFGVPYDPHSFCSSMRVPSHADYQAQLGLPMKKELDAKIGQVLTATGEKTRASLYRDILTTLHDQAVYLPLTHMTSIMVHRPELKDVEFGAAKYDIPFEKMRR